MNWELLLLCKFLQRSGELSNKNVNVTTIMFFMSGDLTGLCLFMTGILVGGWRREKSKRKIITLLCFNMFGDNTTRVVLKIAFYFVLNSNSL